MMLLAAGIGLGALLVGMVAALLGLLGVGSSH